MPRAAPAADAKIGKKIDYFAAELGRALAPHGYSRKARKLWRETGAGDALCFSVLDLQGDKWNEGSTGKFCMNIGVQFPALLRTLGDIDSAPWLSEGAGVPDTALATIRGRLHDALPGQREAWWVREMGHHDIGFEVKKTTDLAGLADVLIRSVLAYVVPWLERHASLEAVLAPGRSMNHMFGTEVVALALLGRREEARAALAGSGAQKLQPERFERMQAWLDGAAPAVK